MTTTASYTYTATEESVPATEKGQIELKVKTTSWKDNNIELKEAMLMPTLKNNLLSVSK